MKTLARYLLIIPVLGAMGIGMLLGAGAQYIKLAAIEGNSHMIAVNLISMSLYKLTDESI